MNKLFAYFRRLVTKTAKKQLTAAERDKKWKEYWDNVKDKNSFQFCRPDQLKLDGKYTKLLKAYAELFGLVHEVEWSKTTFGLGLEVSVTVKNKWYHSSLDVFEAGQAAYVSSMREYTQDARAYSVEVLSKKILEGTFGEGRYIRSLHGGDCVRLVGNSQYEEVPRFELHDIPSDMNQLLVMLASAGIDWENQKVELKKSTY